MNIIDIINTDRIARLATSDNTKQLKDVATRLSVIEDANIELNSKDPSLAKYKKTNI